MAPLHCLFSHLLPLLWQNRQCLYVTCSLPYIVQFMLVVCAYYESRVHSTIAPIRRKWYIWDPIQLLPGICVCKKFRNHSCWGYGLELSILHASLRGTRRRLRDRKSRSRSILIHNILTRTGTSITPRASILGHFLDIGMKTQISG